MPQFGCAERPQVRADGLSRCGTYSFSRKPADPINVRAAATAPTREGGLDVVRRSAAGRVLDDRLLQCLEPLGVRVPVVELEDGLARHDVAGARLQL